MAQKDASFPYASAKPTFCCLVHLPGFGGAGGPGGPGGAGVGGETEHWPRQPVSKFAPLPIFWHVVCKKPHLSF